MKTNELISLLVEDTASIRPISYDLLIAALAGCVAPALILLVGIHLKQNLIDSLGSQDFIFKMFFNLSLASIGMIFISKVARPDFPAKSTIFAITFSAFLLFCGGVFGLLTTPEYDWYSTWLGHTALECVISIPAMALVPFALIFIVLRRGAPAKPGVAGAIAGLAAGGLAGSFYSLHCPEDSPLFVITWYPIGISFMIATGALLGTKKLRW